MSFFQPLAGLLAFILICQSGCELLCKQAAMFSQDLIPACHGKADPDNPRPDQLPQPHHEDTEDCVHPQVIADKQILPKAFKSSLSASMAAIMSAFSTATPSAATLSPAPQRTSGLTGSPILVLRI